MSELETTLDVAMAQYELAWMHHSETHQALKVARAEAEARYRAEMDAAQAATQRLKDAETALHAATLAVYAATKDKQPAPGVGIREVRQYTYDPAKALAWCHVHGLALQVDTKAFETLCKAETMRPDFVTVTVHPVPTIGAALKPGG